MSYEIKVEDVEYLRHGGMPLLARLYRPQGPGPFPIMVELHGGAWCRSDRLADAVIHEPLARSGVIVAALDWRQPPVAPYPASFQDIHYGIRWLKARATELGAGPTWSARWATRAAGTRRCCWPCGPSIPAYGALPQPAGAPAADATVRCVILTSPVIDPLGRYRYAKELKAQGQSSPLVDEVLPCHDAYWQTEAAMAEGAPALALERGERVQHPARALRAGQRGPRPSPSPSRSLRRGLSRAGGQVDLELFDGEGQGFIMRKAGSPASNRAIELIVEFVHKQIR